MVDYIKIKGRQQSNIALAANVAQASPALSAGQYDVWADADVYVRTAPVARNGVLTIAPARAQDVTIANGYVVYAGNIVTLEIQDGDAIGAISASNATFRYMQTG